LFFKLNLKKFERKKITILKIFLNLKKQKSVM